ncbi:Carboxyl-terminal PDZ ligand of neuronal nitric oxide synthase protein [Bagarius yarrelli]|uniref:Carboxyl-terminal PDZ ligand of neuronal nitric oxide synthase protein n=1 Tax=Bagarius yarrelli TaxID=175774 RepID=A0A556UYA6_BAGYA|nr:Carboxyl-terminal PDZ ligand of neuronal nitric oxide synthase protein [Bagarius yarrelli]
MPSRNRYNLVDEAADSRVPLYSDEAFQHGIHFQAKYIGSLDIPRPNSRVEIVAAMRRIRYVFKTKKIKKKKVNMVVSVDGVSVLLRKKQKELEETPPYLQSPGRPRSLSRTPLTDQHHLQFLQQQVLQRQQQAHVAVAQVQLLRDQIAAETAARMEAQARSHQLLLQNGDLLQHIALLVQHVSELEAKVTGHAKNQDWRSSSSCSLTLNLKNCCSSEEPITSTPAGNLQILRSPPYTMACIDSYLSPLQSRTPCIVAANGKPKTGGRNDDLTELPLDRRIGASAMVKEIIPKLDPPPPLVSRKRPNRTESETASSFSPVEFANNLSEDSGMRSGIKPCGDDPFEDHTSALFSTSSSCSSLPEDRPLDETPPLLDSPDSCEPALLFSSPFNETCLHISLSEDELLEDEIFTTESPLSSSLS